ncbi:MAG: chondroitinase-B domain-containing protein [Chitinophagaceae bacterium]
MLKYFKLLIFQFSLTYCFSATIKVGNSFDLQKAEQQAKPGDIIILQNGIWNDVKIKLNCIGTEKEPITFKAETAGKVFISGKSCLKIGGSYIIINGLNFTNGFSPENTIISFKSDKNTVANYCRVTNCLIDDFNKPKRMDDDYWVSLFGKHNRIDHCTFRNKKNLGVLMAVILDDEKSRENFHSIDHNNFDGRPPLGSNSGEIIRIGVSQHCTFNSNTNISDNFFKNCDGETEIISIKSGANIIKNNVFKESQGCVTLRHGNNNNVYNNIFLGNGKEGTGGVRIINEGNWVVNNLFYECKGVSFRSPLAIMNGVPNSPANRYLPVKDAVVFGNSFINCTPFSLCEGSDKERSQVPQNVLIANNVFYNKKDTTVFYQFDSIKGFTFQYNIASNSASQRFAELGFMRMKINEYESGMIKNLTSLMKKIHRNVLEPNIEFQKKAKLRLGIEFSNDIGYSNFDSLPISLTNIQKTTGITWKEDIKQSIKPSEVQCANTKQLLAVLADSINYKKKINISLTGIIYELKAPVKIYNQISISTQKKEIKFITEAQEAVFIIQGNASLNLNNANINGSFIKATNFISSPTNGIVHHYKFSFVNSSFRFYEAANNASFFKAVKGSYADSLVFKNSSFSDCKINILSAEEETDKKGYYSAENIVFSKNKFINNKGTIINIARTGNDESTLGPRLWFNNNTIENTNSDKPLIELYGVQYSNFENNIFTNSNNEKQLIVYTDIVRAIHLQTKNKFTKSGSIKENEFVINK